MAPIVECLTWSRSRFLREGTAVSDFLHPTIIVGADDDRAADVLKRIYLPLTSGSYYRQTDAIAGHRNSASVPPLVLTSQRRRDHQACFQRIPCYEDIVRVTVANLCEATDLDGTSCQGHGSRNRIGPKLPAAGVGYGGSCFPKDASGTAVRSGATWHRPGSSLKLKRSIRSRRSDSSARFALPYGL